MAGLRESRGSRTAWKHISRLEKSVIGGTGVALLAAISLGGAACAGPAAIGARETVGVVELGLAFDARIDTGAAASALHATDVEFLGREVRFTAENERGERRTLRLPIADVAEVRTARGSDRRPRVALHLTLRGVEKRVLVSLLDRSVMQHKLLVGRDFLAGDFVVDVSR